MDKKTLFAVVLAVVVIVGSMVVQSVFFPAPESQPVPAVQAPAQEPQQAQPSPAPAAGSASIQAPKLPEAVEEQTVVLETNVFRVAFSNRGAVATSIELKEYRNADGSPVEMVIDDGSGRYPFAVTFGDAGAPADNALYHVERAVAEPRVEFTRQFLAPDGVPFTLRKTYLLKPNDYLMEMRVTIENSLNQYPALDFQGSAYTLSYGPQIGPEFVKLDRRNEFRNYMAYSDGKVQNLKIPRDGLKVVEERISWAAVVGKYFTVIGLPDATPYRVVFDTRPLPELQDRSSLSFSRPVLRSSRNTDVFRFYIGPKKRDVLLRYNDAGSNGFGLQDLRLEQTVTSSPVIGWLADVLKFFLELFYRFIPNYGVAIILVTMLIKVVLWPLTHKSFESTSKMQALNPKLTEIREKYKSNPQKMNQEIAELYKREGVSPMGGCLPMLLQLPIFFAFYNLLSNHFDLRGASFIPGWINDLSAPEAIVTFEPISLLGIWELQALRALPFVMLLTTFLQSKVTQSPGQGGGQMKMMMYMMPLMFFFILYDMPSGLVLYWTVQNLLSIVQQVYINSRRKAVAGGGGGSNPPGNVRKAKGSK